MSLSGRTALITGVTGQDGSYLAELLIEKGYEVHGTKRKSSTAFNTSRIDHLLGHSNFHLHYADVTDLPSLILLMMTYRPDEVYNLAAQSDVGASFLIPDATIAATAVGAINVFQAVRIAAPKARVYQASSSEMFGNAAARQSIDTPFNPVSPYGAAKLVAHNMAGIFRISHGLFISRGVLFNHESPRRGETFVTRKITRGIARIKMGLQKTLVLGNPHAIRDWGYAKEYVQAMWMMLQKEFPTDYVIGTGKSARVNEFASFVAGHVAGVDPQVIQWSVAYERPTEVNRLQASTHEAAEGLGWSAKTDWRELAQLMYEHDLQLAVEELHNQ